MTQNSSIFYVYKFGTRLLSLLRKSRGRNSKRNVDCTKKFFFCHMTVSPHNFKTNYGLFLEIWEIVLFFCLTLFRGGVQIFTPLPRCDKNKNFGRPKLFTFNIIILDVFCKNLAYVAPPIQIS